MNLLMNPLKQSKQPKNIKVGSCFYSCEAYSFDDGTSTVDLDEWMVRSIRCKRGTQTIYGIKKLTADSFRNKYVNMARKTSYTWVNGKWAKSIPVNDSKQVLLGWLLPVGIFTTRLQAVNSAIKDANKWLGRVEAGASEAVTEEDLKEYQQDVKEAEKELRLLKGLKTRLKNKKLKAVK